LINQPRPTQRRQPKIPDDHELLTRGIVGLAPQFGRYGYRRIIALLRDRGWHVNHKRVERIWRREGLKVPKKQPKRGRLWLLDRYAYAIPGRGRTIANLMDSIVV